MENENKSDDKPVQEVPNPSIREILAHEYRVCGVCQTNRAVTALFYRKKLVRFLCQTCTLEFKAFRGAFLEAKKIVEPVQGKIRDDWNWHTKNGTHFGRGAKAHVWTREQKTEMALNLAAWLGDEKSPYFHMKSVDLWDRLQDLVGIPPKERYVVKSIPHQVMSSFFETEEFLKATGPSQVDALAKYLHVMLTHDPGSMATESIAKMVTKHLSMW